MDNRNNNNIHDQAHHEASVDGIANAIYQQIMANRESLLTAFIAETGLKPSECEVITYEEHKNGAIYLVTNVRRKEVKATSLLLPSAKLKATH